MVLSLGDGVESVMLLRYERLPNHCFKCVMVDHSTYECPSTEQSPAINGVESLQFGIWMRASTPFSKYKNRERGVASSGRNRSGSTAAEGSWRTQQFQKFSAKEVATVIPTLNWEVRVY
ncbi:hypothetical protein LWI28_023130 [Acer negundo]|uniref:Zinc knuckle CX2CX4HX4C domain-containing protein n=1 Tax=Acer negundo TaxID=4023 RepID=A0AAD5NQP1_ACENE|nr:hypothetical protein LWI28_023130 [Acer negundo]